MTKDTVMKEFTKLKGIGATKAELLYNNGYTSFEKLKKATVPELTKLKGITQKNAQDILDQVQDKPTKSSQAKKQPHSKPKKATPTKPKSEAKPEKQQKPPEKEAPEDDVEIVDESSEEYTVKLKPKMTDEQRQQLRIRKQIKRRTPDFLREEWFRYKRIPHNWRRPDGITSKMRINLKYRPSKVRIGFRGPKDVRGLHPSGFEEVLIFNVNELEQINPETQAARIGSTVGTKKRLEIAKKAEELSIRILNMRR